MDFVTNLLILTGWKGNSYDFILVIIYCLIKIVYYNLVKVTIDATGLTPVILDMLVRHYGLPDSHVIDRGLLFTSKFWSLLCYFFGIKCRFSIAFHPQINGQTKKKNSTIKAYLCIFISFEQTTRLGFYPQPNLIIIMPRIQTPVTFFLS